MKKRRFFIIFILFVVSFISFFILFKQRERNIQKVILPTPYSFQEKAEEKKREPVILEQEEINTEKELPSLPDQINLAVPFISQAPLANWDLPYKEACEEASLLMVHSFYRGDPLDSIDPLKAREDILAMVAVENELFGYYESTTIEELGLLAEKMYGYKSVIKQRPSLEEIKQALYLGYPVFVPASGRDLNNPHFQTPGPIYHMFILKGYTSDSFITNDPGTRYGENYLYPFEKILNANHDFADPIEKGEPRMLILEP